MEMVGYEKVLRNIILVTALLNVTLNALLVPVIGIYGAAVATSTSLVVWNLITNWYIRRRDGLRTYFWWK